MYQHALREDCYSSKRTCSSKEPAHSSTADWREVAGASVRSLSKSASRSDPFIRDFITRCWAADLVAGGGSVVAEGKRGSVLSA
jgi:hypothetical protein